MLNYSSHRHLAEGCWLLPLILFAFPGSDLDPSLPHLEQGLVPQQAPMRSHYIERITVKKVIINYTYFVSLLSNQTNGFSNW